MPNSLDPIRLLRARSLVLLERILGFCDRDEDSPNLGCCDRWYWRYKLHDLANARFQEAAQYLVLAAPLCSEASRAAVSRCASKAVAFWARMRHLDGSVDEIYPFERSFCATSMSAQAASFAHMCLEQPPKTDFSPTGRWLMLRDNAGVANQMAGACLALARIGRITGRDSFTHSAKDKMERIAQAQLADGCYAEYGGPDAGYATITLALLAQYHALTGDPRAMESMARCEAWLRGVVDENGLFDWQSMSRRTQFLYPSGLAYLDSPVLERLCAGLEKNVAISPLWMDDRYCVPLAADYLLAAEMLEDRA